MKVGKKMNYELNFNDLVKTVNRVNRDEYIKFSKLAHELNIHGLPRTTVYATNVDSISAVVGCIYHNGDCAVVGCHTDKKCSYDDMLQIIINSL